MDTVANMEAIVYSAGFTIEFLFALFLWIEEVAG